MPPAGKHSELASGAVVGGRFVLEETVGAGGMGVVWRARDAADGRRLVAIKVMAGVAGEQALGRFAREARVLSELDHPGIVRHVASGTTDEGAPFVAMEWLEGVDLETHLRRRTLGIEETLELLRRVATALAYVHGRGVVHRDLKPANLFLARGDVFDVRLLDFGIARIAQATRVLTRTGLTIGTPGYMAPEQARGERSVGPPADVFSLGCIAFECLSGRAAFEGPHPIAVLAKVLMESPRPLRELVPDIPERLERLVGSMLAREPSERPANGTALVEAIDRIHELTVASLSPPPNRPSLSAREQQLASVVVAMSRDAGEVNEPLEHAATIEQPASVEAIVARVAPFGGEVERLADGTVLVLVRGGGSAEAQAERAERCARSLHELTPGHVVAVATGRAELGGPLPVGEAIDRAVALCLEAGMGDRIGLDEVTARLLEGRTPATEHEHKLLGRAAPFVGRRREVATIGAAVLGAIEEGQAACVRVTGDAGIGKSRLMEAVWAELPDGTERWLARAEPAMQATPLGVIASALREAAGLSVGSPIETRRRRLRDWCASFVPEAERERATAFAGELVGAPFDDGERPWLRAARADPRLMAEQLGNALDALARTMLDVRPLVVVLEDLHWADEPSVRLVDRWLGRFSQAPLAVLALGRPDARERFGRAWERRAPLELSLSGISDRAAEQMVREALGEGFDGAESLVARAGGNPFFLEELIRHVAQGDRTSLPPTVAAITEARLTRLGPEVRRLLRAASVLGDRFWSSAVAVLCDAPARRAEELLAFATAEELVEPWPDSRYDGEREHRFRHTLVREAAYAMLTDEDRVLGHRIAAEWLEAHGERDAALLAHHLELGGEGDRAAARLAEAAEHAMARDALAGAQAHVERALSLASDDGVRVRCLLTRAGAFAWRGELAAAEADTRRARELAPRGSDAWAEATARLASTRYRQGAGREVVVLGQELAASPPQGASAPLANLSVLVVAQGEHELGERLVAMAAERNAAAGDLAQPRAFLALLRADLGGYVVAMEQALAAAVADGARRVASHRRVNLGWGLCALGQLDEAEACLRQALAEAEGLGLDPGHARSNLGFVLLQKGELDEARTVLQSVAVERNVEQALTGFACLAEALRRSGDLEAAEPVARSAVRLAQAHQLPLNVPGALATLARVLLDFGRPADALPVAQDALALLAEAPGAFFAPRVRLVHALALHDAGALDAACAALDEARERLLAQANSLPERYRDGFLRDVPEHRETLALRWAGP